MFGIYETTTTDSYSKYKSLSLVNICEQQLSKIGKSDFEYEHFLTFQGLILNVKQREYKLIQAFNSNIVEETLSQSLQTFPIDVIYIISTFINMTQAINECEHKIFKFFKNIIDNREKESIRRLLKHYGIQITIYPTYVHVAIIDRGPPYYIMSVDSTFSYIENENDRHNEWLFLLKKIFNKEFDLIK